MRRKRIFDHQHNVKWKMFKVERMTSRAEIVVGTVGTEITKANDGSRTIGTRNVRVDNFGVV